MAKSSLLKMELFCSNPIQNLIDIVKENKCCLTNRNFLLLTFSVLLGREII